MEYSIVNMVASANLNVPIDLFNLALEAENVEYEPEQFPGAILRLEEPKTTFLVFKTGRVVCAGAKNEKEIVESLKKAAEIIKKIQPGAKIPEKIPYRVQNLVATANLNVSVDLYSLATSLDNVEYEPEQFPGAILKLDKPSTTILLFKNGKLICAGAKNEKEIVESIEKVREIIQEFVEK